MKERARGQERWEERLPGGGSCLGKGPKEEGAWRVQELERKPVHLYTRTCMCTLTHACVSIIPRTPRSAPASSEPINSAPSSGSSLFSSVGPSNPQVQFELPPYPCHFLLTQPYPPDASHTLCLPHSETFQGCCCPGGQNRALQPVLWSCSCGLLYQYA